MTDTQDRSPVEQAPRTTAGRKLLERLDALETVSVQYAPAHSAPFISKSIVLPIVEMLITRIEAEAASPAVALLREALDAAAYEADADRYPYGYYILKNAINEALTATPAARTVDAVTREDALYWHHRQLHSDCAIADIYSTAALATSERPATEEESSSG